MSKRRIVIIVGSMLTVLIMVGYIGHEASAEEGGRAFWSVAIPGILTGVGTIGLALFTALVVYGDQVDRRKREASERDLADKAQRQQAEGVVHWSGTKKFDNGMVFGGLVVRNGSMLPIWDVQIYWRRLDTNKLAKESAVIDVIAPGADELSTFPAGNGNEREHYPEVYFRDSNEVTWLRTHRGRLFNIGNLGGFKMDVKDYPDENQGA